MAVKQAIKDWLVGFGPQHPLVQLALRLHGLKQGYRIGFDNARILIKKKHRTMVLSHKNYIHVPMSLKLFDFYFDTVEPKESSGKAILDFSQPGLHRYRKWGIEMLSLGIPEDDSYVAYTHRFKPTEGMVVFDMGAHAGLTTYFFSQAVGPSGRVYAFEPDNISRGILIQNIERHGLGNVIVREEAISGQTGTAIFNNDPTKS
jgi:hypothetical protein